jgi:aryl-alcohol dehydrogenase-like predicted oxidoreductase
VSAAREFSALAASRDLPPARAALAWVAQLDGVTTVIPGARSPEQARQNATAGSVPPLGEDFTAAVTELYDLRLRDSIHDLW